MALLADAGNRIAFLAGKIRFLRMKSLERKIAAYFSDLRGVRGDGFVRLPYSLEELSELFGVTRPALSRSLGLLVKDGVLQRSGRLYRVADPVGLERLAVSEDGP